VWYLGWYLVCRVLIRPVYGHHHWKLEQIRECNDCLNYLCTGKEKVRFQVPTAASMKTDFFWVVAPCSLVEIYRHFSGTCCLHHQGNDDDGDSRDVWSVGKFLREFLALQPRRHLPCCQPRVFVAPYCCRWKWDGVGGPWSGNVSPKVQAGDAPLDSGLGSKLLTEKVEKLQSEGGGDCCRAMKCNGFASMFRKNVMLPSSGLKCTHVHIHTASQP
jgi:hypothetical protein